MDNKELSTDELISLNNQERTPSAIDTEDIVWGEELDEYLDYIDSLNPDHEKLQEENYQKDTYDDLDDLEPYVELGVYKTKSIVSKTNRKHRNTSRITATPIIVCTALLVVGLCGWGIFPMKDRIIEAFYKDDQLASTEQVTTTETPITEEATTEDPYGPYATREYILHKPHVTDNTIVFDSNPHSLRFAGTASEENNNDETTDEPSTENLYPAITLTPVEGSLNATNPDPSNPEETQQMTSRYMVLIDLSDDSIVAKRDSDLVVYPASMTKILTVLTACDVIKDLNDTYVITQEEIQYAYSHDCSAVGFLDGETVTVKDLLYGTIVCSGGDAAVGLANYCYGSHDAFVEKMNEKVAELGLSETAHFTNVVGIFNEDLHCTMEDMAVILATAFQNDLCREILSTRVYTTTPYPSFLPKSETGEDGAVSTDNENATDEQTDTKEDDTTEEETAEAILQVATTGITISNWFMRRIEDKDTGGEVLGAKTGFVNASGFCAASYYKSASGKEYICVTGDTYSSWRCIYDHVGIYRSLAK